MNAKTWSLVGVVCIAYLRASQDVQEAEQVFATMHVHTPVSSQKEQISISSLSPVTKLPGARTTILYAHINLKQQVKRTALTQEEYLHYVHDGVVTANYFHEKHTYFCHAYIKDEQGHFQEYTLHNDTYGILDRLLRKQKVRRRRRVRRVEIPAVEQKQ